MVSLIFLLLGMGIGWMMRGWKINWSRKAWTKAREE